MSKKTYLMKKAKQAAAAMIVLAMCISTPMAALADTKEADAKTIKLSKIIGTVSVNKGTKTVPKVTEGMRMHDGHTVTTDKESNAFFELDASKYIKMDQVSKVKIQKSKDTNKLMVESGTVFFNVTKPLTEEETMEIKTPTITMGVRGTSGVVGFQESDGDDSSLYVATVQIYTGLGMVTVGSDIEGEGQVYPVAPGTQIQIKTDVSTGSVNVEAGKLDLSGANIPAVAAEEIVQNQELQKAIETLTEIKITEEVVQQKKAEENAKVEVKEAVVNQAKETIKPENKDHGFTNSSNDKSDSRPSETNVLTGNITDVELLNALQKYDQVIMKNGTIRLTKSIDLPIGKSLVLEQGGTLDLGGFDLKLFGELINNSSTSVRLGNNVLYMEGKGRLTNNGTISGETGKILVNGAEVYIKNTAGKVIPHIELASAGYATIENEVSSSLPGKINQITGADGSKLRFVKTLNKSSLNYGVAGSFKDGLGTSEAEVTFEEDYHWDGSCWKIAQPKNMIYAKNYKTNLAATIETLYAGGETTVTVGCIEAETPDKLEKSLTIPAGKTLIITGPSGCLALDKPEILINNSGTIQIGTEEKAGELQEAGETPGNIVNNANTGKINVINGILMINDNGDDTSTALGGDICVEAKGILKVYSGPNLGQYWGHISGYLVVEEGSTIDLNGSNSRSLVYLNITGINSSIDRGAVITKNNTSSGITYGQAFGGKGTKAEPYLINSSRDLRKLKTLVESTVPGNIKYKTAYYKQVEDITFTEDEVWSPIGTSGKPFMGSFDGNDLTISNLHTAKALADDIGLFGVVIGADIENVTLEDADIYGQKNVGGIVGQAVMDNQKTQKTVIRNCKVSGKIEGTSDHTGGIVGLFTASSIELCVNRASITGQKVTGGIVGKMLTGATLSECYNRGSISSSGSAGGLTGESLGGVIENSYNEGAVFGNVSAGGVIGYLQAFADVSANINCTYNRGSVSGAGSKGGIVGKIHNDSAISSPDRIIIMKNAALGSIGSGGHRIVGEYANPKHINSFTVSNNYGSGTVQNVDEKYDGLDEASFDSDFWFTTVKFGSAIWDYDNTGDPSSCNTPTLKNVPEGQSYSPMMLAMPSIDGAEIYAADNQNAIAAAIENNFENEDMVTLVFEENESAELEKNLTIPAGKTLRILGTSLQDRDKASGLIVPKSVTLTNNGTIEIGAEYEAGLPTECGVLSQSAAGKNTIVNNGTIDLKQGVFRISADAEDTTGIEGEIIVGQEAASDSSLEEPLASLMVYSGNNTKETYWGKIGGEVTVLDNGRIDLFHENDQVTVKLLLLAGAGITESGEDSVYVNPQSGSKVIFAEELSEETKPSEEHATEPEIKPEPEPEPELKPELKPEQEPEQEPETEPEPETDPAPVPDQKPEPALPDAGNNGNIIPDEPSADEETEGDGTEENVDETVVEEVVPTLTDPGAGLQ